MAANGTTNGSTSNTLGCGPSFGDSYFSKVAIITANVAMSFLAILGNSLVVRIIQKNPRMRTSFNYYIANMAASDVLVQFFSTPRIVSDALLAPRVWLITGPFGEILCKLVFFVQDICTAVSIECLVLIAIDRFLAVVTPTRARSTSTKIRAVIIIMTWVVAGLISSPQLHFSVLYKGNNTHHVRCVIDWGSFFPEDAHNKYIAFLVFFLFVSPFVVIATLYAIIFVVVKRRKVPGNETCVKQQLRPHQKARMNVLKLACVVVVIFVFSWLPQVVFLFLLMTEWGWDMPCNMRLFRFLALFLAYSTTMTNPCVYFMFSANYRQGLRKMFPWLGIKYKRSSLIQSRTRSRARTWQTNQTDSGAEANIGGHLVTTAI